MTDGAMWIVHRHDGARGEEGLDAFRETKHVHIDYIQERNSYWFPYAGRQW